ncbi:hypothetical protein JGH11_09985 [Dysgonomonas sp. Marseille-P4677]|uniref:hypothetical protein n=1 Tax=Dysgonomonas sp. Marseille-P4677 TaxID=2364790 RepID=UPI001914C996|nr:hypothetical protein [Dysgonomonas sp. Marseille-P4677]MBK5721198.1 hypothetical protein [Dysgonomonas sp. Marseille-P4677]
MKIIRFILLLFFLVNALSSVSQTNTDILKYLDDGGISTSIYTAKINISSIYEGEISPSVERLFSDNFALEVGVGLLLPSYKDPILYDLLTNPDDDDFTFDDPRTGYSFMVNPKYYLSEQSQGFYWALPLRYKVYPAQIHLFDFSTNLGMQWTWDSGLVLDVSLGIGATIQDSKDKKSYIFDASSKTDIDYEAHGIITGDGVGNSEPAKIRFLLPFSLKLGYRFKSR